MEPVFVLWTVLSILFVVGNLCGVGLFHKLEREDYNLHRNKFTFWFLTTVFLLILGWAYAPIRGLAYLLKKRKQN